MGCGSSTAVPKAPSVPPTPRGEQPNKGPQKAVAAPKAVANAGVGGNGPKDAKAPVKDEDEAAPADKTGGLTAKEKALVESSWALLSDAAHPDNTKAALTGVGMGLFKLIFDNHPGVVEMFSFQDEIGQADQPKLKEHSYKVAFTVGVCVSLLGDLSTLTSTVDALVRRHFGYGVALAHYDVVLGLLATLLSRALDAQGQWDDAMAGAWTKVVGLIKAVAEKAYADAPPPAAAAAAPKGAVAAEEKGMTAKDIDLVRSSWALLSDAAHPDNTKAALTEVGLGLYKLMFDKHPELADLFSFKDEIGQDNKPKTRAHAYKVMSTVGACVSLLDDVPTLASTVEALVVRHYGYGVVLAHYDVVLGLLATLLSQALGAQGLWDDAMAGAWTKVVGLIQQVAEKTYAEKPPAAPAAPAGPAAPAAAAPAEKSGGMSEKEKELVESSWALLSDAANPDNTKAALTGVGMGLFKLIFDNHPGVVEMFSFKDEIGQAEQPKLKEHSYKVASTVGVCVSLLGNLPTLESTVDALVRRHFGYGVALAHYDVVLGLLATLLSQALGAQGLWDDAMAGAWTKVVGLIKAVAEKAYASVAVAA